MEQIGVADHAALDDFVEAGAVLARGQGPEDVGIDQDRQGLVKAADQVLAGDQIHAGLAAYRGVHLSQQRGGDLNHGNAAHEDRRQESGDVA